MNIYLSIDSTNVDKLPVFISSMKATGGEPDHSLTLIPSTDAQVEANEALVELQPLFQSVSIEPGYGNVDDATLAGKNRQFGRVVRRSLIDNQKAFILVDASCIVTKRGWADRIIRESEGLLNLLSNGDRLLPIGYIPENFGWDYRVWSNTPPNVDVMDVVARVANNQGRTSGIIHALNDEYQWSSDQDDFAGQSERSACYIPKDVPAVLHNAPQSLRDAYIRHVKDNEPKTPRWLTHEEMAEILMNNGWCVMSPIATEEYEVTTDIEEVKQIEVENFTYSDTVGDSPVTQPQLLPLREKRGRKKK